MGYRPEGISNTYTFKNKSGWVFVIHWQGGRSNTSFPYPSRSKALKARAEYFKHLKFVGKLNAQ